MALRQIEIFFPIERKPAFDEVIEEFQVTILWKGTDDLGVGMLAMIVADAYQIEPLISGLLARFQNEDAFRMVVFEAGAVYPSLEEKETEDDQEKPEADGTAPKDDDEPKRSPARIAIEELEVRLAGGAKLDQTFVVMVLLSALVAAVGLLKNNTAVVIGAMVIAPLLGPNMALALGTTLGKVTLIRKSLWTNTVGVSIAFVFALLLGLVMEVDPTVPEIASRTSVDVMDIVLALAAGVAGALAFTTGVPAALVGVMVAVALLPPLTCAGLLIGSGNFQGGAMAALLTAINVICVNLSAVATFASKGIKPRSYYEHQGASKMTRIALLLWIGMLAVLAALMWVAQMV
jgi:uncharacterized hydrophobic protein (TIGR00341 family)